MSTLITCNNLNEEVKAFEDLGEDTKKRHCKDLAGERGRSLASV